jgi:hypothetical protein
MMRCRAGCLLSGKSGSVGAPGAVPGAFKPIFFRAGGHTLGRLVIAEPKPMVSPEFSLSLGRGSQRHLILRTESLIQRARLRLNLIATSVRKLVSLNRHVSVPSKPTASKPREPGSGTANAAIPPDW